MDLNYILFISKDEGIHDVLRHVSKRLGAKKIVVCHRISQALALLHDEPFPTLILEDVGAAEKEELFVTYQENRLKEPFVPVPVFGIVSPLRKSDIDLVEHSDYIGFQAKPLNETMLEQEIREIFYESYSYDQSCALNEVVEHHIANKKIKLAFNTLMPALALKPKNASYLLLYSLILFEKKNYNLCEKVSLFVLKLEPENLKAKNILAKIYIATERYEEAENIQS